MSGSIGSGKALRPEGPMSPPGAAGRVVRPLAGRGGPVLRKAFGLVSGSGGRGVHRLAEQAPVPAVLGCGECSGAGLFRDGMAEQRAVHGGGTDQEILSGTPPEGGVGSMSGGAGPRAGRQATCPGAGFSAGAVRRGWFSGPTACRCSRPRLLAAPDWGRGRRRFDHLRTKCSRSTPSVHDGRAGCVKTGF